MISHCSYNNNIQHGAKTSPVVNSKDKPLFGKASKCINNSILLGKITFVSSMALLTLAASTAALPLAILGVTAGLVGLSGFIFTQFLLDDDFSWPQLGDKDRAACLMFSAQPKKLQPSDLQLRSEILQLTAQPGKNSGTLAQNKAYVYLKLDPNYLSQIFQKIKTKFPQAKKATGKTGPHISIIRHDEWKGVPPQKINELFKKHHFKPIACKTIPKGAGRLWMLTVKPSAKLQAIRDQYAVGSKPHGHNFHITIAEEAKSAHLN